MEQLNVFSENGIPYSEKGQRQFFQPVIQPLILSREGQKLKELPYNTWLFQLINIYQGNRRFQGLPQVWRFIKRENDVLAICEDLQGNVLALVGNDIFDQHKYFQNLTLFVCEGKCKRIEKNISRQLLLQSA